MAILNGDRKKCLDEMGFGSMIGMGIHELPGKLGFYVIDNLDTETNVLSLTDNSILVTSQSVHDILGIPMGRCSIESLAPRSPDDPFIKEWLSQFGDKNEVRPNDITDVIVSTKDASKFFKMNFLMLFANTMGLCKKSGVCNMNILKKITDDVCVEKIDCKMESDSPVSDDDNQKSVDDDSKQDVVMDEIDEQNKEDLCKEAHSIHENKFMEIRLTYKRHAWRKKSVMDNENKDAEAVELSSSIKSKDEQIVHKADTSKKVNEKCTSEESINVEQAETQVEMNEIINECNIDVECSKNEKETS
nr:hypothetical protein [Tanacetum cinerariifolium]